MKDHSSEKSEQIEAHVEPEFPAVQMVLDEIWEIIFGYLNQKRDLHTVCNSWSEWQRILEPTKSAWMFAQVLPLVINNLSRQEILKCRLVCKRWCREVDYFCENNVSRRPAFGEDDDDLSAKMDLRQLELHTTLGYKTFHSDWTSIVPNEKMLIGISAHPQNPIVGRCVTVEHCRSPVERQEYKCMLGNRFLKKFGRYIHFLQIRFHDTQPLEFLKSVVELFELFDLSNLRSLEIKTMTNMEISECRELTPVTEYVTNLTWKQGIFKPGFPSNLETLVVDMVELHPLKLNDALVMPFSGNLKTLEICNDTFIYKLPFQSAHLCDLRIKVESRYCLQGLLRVKSPIQRLKLTVKIDDRGTGSVGIHRLVETINRFDNSLRFLHLKLILKDCRTEYLEQFLTQNRLDLPHLKTVVFESSSLSFNFISGLTSIEYLHIDGIHMYEQRNLDSVNFEEQLDICQKLKETYNIEGRHPNMHGSNLWTRFKRLKEITIKVHERLGQAPKAWKYRRSSENKFQK